MKTLLLHSNKYKRMSYRLNKSRETNLKRPIGGREDQDSVSYTILITMLKRISLSATTRAGQVIPSMHIFATPVG